MSIPNLPVNFKDDILAASNPKRKYQQTFNSDGSVSLEDVTSYSQQGSDFGASQINQTNKAINNIYTERILTLDELELVTEPGFFVDAEAVKEAYDELNGNIQKAIKRIPKQATKIVTGSGTNVLYPYTISDVQDMFGDESIGVEDVTVVCQNADFDTVRLSVDSVVWQGNTLVVFLSGNLPSGSNIRINSAFIANSD